jgi:phage shock protein C
MARKLYRSKENKILGGVCGGIAEYLDVDPTLIRLLFVLVLLFSGIGPVLILYLIAWAIIPEKPRETVEPAPKTGTYEMDTGVKSRDSEIWTLAAILIVVAIILCVFGLWAISRWFHPWFGLP